MVTPTRRTSISIVEQLLKEPYRFEFVQAVRILEKIAPEFPPLGKQSDPRKELLQLRSRVFLSAPPSNLYSLKLEETVWGRPVLNVNFMGLAGIQGPLPLPFTEKVLDRQKARDSAMEDFLNLFNHRLLAIYYRIQVKFNVGTQDKSPEETEIGCAARALMGIGHHDLQNRQSVADRSLLNFTQLFWQKPKSIWGLKQILISYFKVPIKIKPFQGHWKNLQDKDATYLGSKKGRYQRLGQAASLGKRYWDEVAGIILKIGPLSFESYHEFLPRGKAFRALNTLVKFYLGEEYDVFVKIGVINSSLPLFPLGESALGWTSFLKARKPEKVSWITIKLK